jgi:hypothetical protein
MACRFHEREREREREREYKLKELVASKNGSGESRASSWNGTIPCPCTSRSRSPWGSVGRHHAPRLSSAAETTARISGGRRNRACSVSPKGERRKIADHLGHDGAVGVLDDRRQGAVVVQEHHDLLPARRRERRLEPRQCRRVILLRAVGITTDSIDL